MLLLLHVACGKTRRVLRLLAAPITETKLIYVCHKAKAIGQVAVASNVAAAVAAAAGAAVAAVPPTAPQPDHWTTISSTCRHTS